MSTFFILIYLASVIAVLLGIAGFTMLIYGLAVKKKKLTISGSIMTAIAIIIIISGVFFGARKVGQFVISKCHKHKMECMREFGPDRFGMPMDSIMQMEDSIITKGDTCCEKMKMTCGDHMKKMKCVKMKCTPGECKSKCSQEKK